MPSARLPSQPKTLATLTECIEEASSKNGRRSSDGKRGVNLNLKEDSQEEMSTDLSSRSTISKNQCLNQSGLHHLRHSHHHQHKHLSHLRGSASAKLVNHSHSKSTEPLYKIKHHQPHCQHYSPNQHQKKQYHHQSNHHLQHHQSHFRLHHHKDGPSSRLQHRSSSHRLHRTNSDLSNDIVAKNSRCKASRFVSKQKDAPYLLVEQLPGSTSLGPYQGEFMFHRATSGSGFNNNNGAGGQPRYAREVAVCRENLKRATVKFISQLYFLLHLSAILSLLLHHKSLTATIDERKPTDSQPLAAGNSPGLIRPKKLAAFVNTSFGSEIASGSVQQNVRLLPQSLPQPMSQSSPTGPTTESNRLPRLIHSDFLVRVLGLWQARLALHNFLSYLLLTSIAILICMRLCRICLKPTVVSHSKHYQESRSLESANCSPTDQLRKYQTTTESGFFQRTRLDCTPVLVGSISLGVIQLIMIGFDFANNLHTDWFTKARWPTAYLPFFQFAFVALLIQYILGKVAKNHEQGKPSNDKNNSNKFAGRMLAEPTISFEKRFTWTSAVHSSGTTGDICNRSPVRLGFKNIALAHLLVTHILLWLLRLNSISLFRAVGDETPSTVSQINHLTGTSGNKHVRHYNLTSVDPSIVSDASFNLEASLRKATDTNLHAIGAPPPRSLFNKPLSTFTDVGQTLVDSAKSSKLNQQQPASNKRSREAVDIYNKIHQIPISDSIGLQHFRLVPTNASPDFNLDAALSKSQQQLMQLINLATKTRPVGSDYNTTGSLAMVNSFPAQSPPPVITYIRTTTVAPPTHSPKPQNMPKRPTVFRQNPPSLVTTNLSTNQPPHRLITTSHQHGSLRTATAESNPEQRQRVRVLLSRAENPSLEPNYKRINRPQLKRINSLERPFPSVESDPLGSVIPTSTKAPVATTTSLTTTTTTTAAPMTSTVVEVERDEAGNNSTAEEEPEEEGEDETSEVSETPQPPSQKYNRTLVTSAPDEEGSKPSATDTRLVTDEEALLAHFGESTRLDSFSAPSALVSAVASANDLNIIRSYPESSSKFERRFLEQETHSDATSDRLSFADYLLPIVQQYHILFIAILFNIWLEGLRTKDNEQDKKLEDCNNQPPGGIRPYDRRFLLGQSNLLSSGSDESRNRTDFFAIPVPRSSLALGLDSVSKLDFGSGATSAGYRGSSTRCQAYAIRKHLSQSMDSLRHPREPMNQDDDTSSGLSRHNSLRSSSSEQLLSTSGRNKRPIVSSRSPLLNPSSQQLLQQQQQQQAAALPLLSTDKGFELSACSLLFGLITVCITLMVLIANQNYLSALAQCTILLASVLLCMVGLCLSNLTLPGELRRYYPEPRHLQCLHLIFILAGYYHAITLLLNLDKRHTPGQPLPMVLLQFIHRHLLPTSDQVNHLFMFQLLLALKGFMLVLQVTLQTVLIRVSLNRPIGHLRQVYTSLMFANMGLWALELRDEQQFLNQYHHHPSSYNELGASRDIEVTSSIPSLSLMNELSNTLVTLSHFYHALVFLQR